MEREEHEEIAEYLTETFGTFADVTRDIEDAYGEWSDIAQYAQRAHNAIRLVRKEMRKLAREEYPHDSELDALYAQRPVT